MSIKADDNSEYIFFKRAKTPAHPFEDLENLFGLVSLNSKLRSPREKIRRRLRKNVAV